MSIASEISRLQTSKADVKTQVNVDKDLINGGTAFIGSETVDDYDDKIKEMQEAYKKYIPIQTETGTTSITLDNTSGDKAMTSISLYGNAVQSTTTGKNKFDNTITKKNQGAYSKIDDTTLPTGKKLTFIDTSGTGTAFLVYAVIDLTNYVGSTIRFKTNYTASGSAEGSAYIGLCNSDGSNRSAKSFIQNSGDTADFVVPTLEGSQTYLCLALYVNNASSVYENDYVEYTNMILTIDNNDMTYEKYTGRNSFT